MRDKVARIRSAVVKIVSLEAPPVAGQARVGLGSGFLVSADGHIVTNSHVVRSDDPSLTQVIFPRGRPITCSGFVMRDLVRDYTILKIADSTFPFLTLGSYDDVEEGDPIMFCGYPLEEDPYSAFPTTHMGYISSKLPAMVDGNQLNICKLDGSVNNGNSGGPLLSQETEKVVGIITQKVGGIDNKMKEFVEVFRSAPSVFTINFGNRSYDPNRTLAEFMDLMAKYSNVGIGIAFSIEYAKAELQRRAII